MNNMSPDHLFDQALQIHMLGNLESAAEHYLRILEKHPNHAETLHHLGLTKLQRGEVKEAISWIRRSIQVNDQQSNALSNLGYCLNLIRGHEEALSVCKKSIALDAENDAAWTNLGNAQRELRLTDKARESYQKALELQPNNHRYFYNLANAFYDLKSFVEAQNLFEKTIALEPNMAEARNNLSACLISLKKFEEALSHTAIAIDLKPDYAEAWSNRGNALKELERHEEALASYQRCIELKPDYAEAWSNRGNALKELKRHEEALASHQRCIELKPDYAEAWNNRGNALNDLKRHEQAMASYEQAYKIKPEIDFLLGSLIHTQMQICDWTDLDARNAHLRNGIETGQKFANPFPVLGLFDDPELQRSAAEIYANEKHQPTNQLGPIARRRKGERIRIGYFSMDFREHPVAHLTADLFELHDRNQFEVYGFSFGTKNQDPMRQRLEKSFDKFLDVDQLNNVDIARLSRELKIDIGIDLGGHTKDSRPQIFSERAAPIQVSYLGYPGTWGSPCMDYFIGDKTTITSKSRDYFLEKIVYMPEQFQVNPISRPRSELHRNRTELGLPVNAIVFCCFNNNWKMTPRMFESWIKILEKVPRSVLWLYAENPGAAKNLLERASEYGISGERLIFAKRVDREEYIAQYCHADLFLDTLPYNAGTTASDALWAGLPVLTCAGESFASRMAASLLEAVGLPELITHSLEQYETLAIGLAADPEKLKMFKNRLMQNRATTTLFDTPRFTKHLESAYQEMYERYQADLPPDHIYISS
jgi:protein O-GlcNAc transferase